MAANIKKGASRDAYFSKYQTSGKFKKNREKKLLKLAKENPNNKQVFEALNSIPSYRRKTPKTPRWSKTKRAETIISKIFRVPTGYVLNLAKMPNNYGDFMLGARVRWKF